MDVARDCEKEPLSPFTVLRDVASKETNSLPGFDIRGGFLSNTTAVFLR